MRENGVGFYLVLGATLLVGAIVGIIISGFSVGREAQNSPPIASASPARSPERSAPPTSGHIHDAALGEMNDFSSIVDHLSARGFDDAFAEWAAFAILAEKAGPSSFELAVKLDKVPLWASVAAIADPRGAFDRIRALPSESRSRPLLALLVQIGQNDPDLGLEILAQLPPESASIAAFQFFKTWSGNSPLAAAEMALQLKSPMQRSRALSGTFDTWSVIDPAGMIAWASQQGRTIGQSALRSFYVGDGMRDPEKVLRLMQAYPAIGDSVTVSEIARSLAQRGAGGWRVLAELPESPRKNQLMMRFGEALVRTDPKLIFELGKNASPSERLYLWQIGVSRISQVSPEEMARFAVNESRWPSYQFWEAVGNWAKQDPQGALAWTTSSLKGRQKMEAMGATFTNWAASDPRAAVSAMSSLSPGVRTKLLPDIAQAWGQSDPTAALTWASALGPLDKAVATNSVVQAWSRNDPSAAAGRIREMSPQGLEQAFESVGYQLAVKSPNASLAWIDSLPTDSAREVAIARVVQGWGEQNAEAASDYVESLQPGKLRDRATEGLVQAIRSLDPEAARFWARTIQDETRRKNLIRSLQ